VTAPTPGARNPAGNDGRSGARRRLPAALRRGDGLVQRDRPRRGGARRLVARPAAPGAVVAAQLRRRLPPLLHLRVPLVLRHLLLEAPRLHPQRSPSAFPILLLLIRSCLGLIAPAMRLARGI
jgi:hypothetical protein